MQQLTWVFLATISLMAACQTDGTNQKGFNKVSESGFLETGFQDSLITFTPDGYVILDTSFGDLNLDRIDDVVVVYKRSNEEQLWQDSSVESERPLLIYLGQSDGTVRFAERTDNAVMCHTCGGAFGDPFVEVTINQGGFTVHHFGGSSDKWSRMTTFNYEKAESTWTLFQDETGYFNMFNPDEETKEVKTIRDFGKVTLKDYTVN